MVVGNHHYYDERAARRTVWCGGAATGDLLWVLAVVAALWILWFATGGTERPAATAGPFIKPPPPIGTGEIYSTSARHPVSSTGRSGADSISGGASAAAEAPADDPNHNHSIFFGQVRISAGSARYEIQPNREYITLTAARSNQIPIDLTDWQLANNALRHSRVSVARIALSILLAPGGVVTVNTGSPPSSNLWPVGSAFQINKCTGYLAEDFRNFRLTPAFSRSCPAPRAEPGIEFLADDCYDYVSRLSACHTPEFERRADGYNYVDGRRDTLSSQCRAYIKDHFSYNRCVAWHGADPDFFGQDWRVFLNHTGELWAANREVMTLYDRGGKIVDQLDY
ncbi:MAG: hypothetical protein HY481_00745 [Candidatus Vogelbacteria bacterium]|nr:hypothetical protein [Candidatus Vogelbacteria bacterium]